MSFSVIYRNVSAVLQEEIETFIAEWHAGKESFTVSTSGSTGKPKSIELQRFQLLNSAKRTLDFFDLTPGKTALAGLSPATIGGKMMIVRALIGGLKLIVCQPASNPLLALLPGETVDFCPMVPMQLKTIVDTHPGLLDQVGTILIGGSPLPEQLEQELIVLHPRVFIGFGMTETVSHIAIRQAGTAIYSALGGVSFGQNGENLVISDELSAIDSLQTTDSVNLVNSTQFEWLGRTDFVINSGGIKIHPEQLERFLSRYIEAPFFIGSVPDVTFGEIAILVVDKTSNPLELAAIQDLCRAEFGRYAVPKSIVYTSIVHNGTKINRKATLSQPEIDR